MDNGQHSIVAKPIDGLQPNLTPPSTGAGDIPTENANYKPENNLNEESWQQALNISKPVDMPSPTKVAETAKTTGLETASNQPSIRPGAELGQTVIVPESPNFKPPEGKDLQLGQIATIENSISLPEVKKNPNYNPDSIKTVGDKLESSSIAEIDNAINELNQTGNLGNFYEEIRGMTEANLSNSFNRKLYQGDSGENK